MGDLLLAEELFLLTHDDETGRDCSRTYLEYGLAGAVLLDLALAERLVSKDGRLLAVGDPPEQPLLAGIHERIARERPRRAQHWVTSLPRQAKIGRQVGEALVARGVLTERRSKALGLFPRTSWPERDPEPERRLRARITATLVDGVTPTPPVAALVALLEALDVTRRLVAGGLDREQRRQALARAKAIARDQKTGAGVASAVAASVRDAQAAIMAATVASVAASAAATAAGT